MFNAEQLKTIREKAIKIAEYHGYSIIKGLPTEDNKMPEFGINNVEFYDKDTNLIRSVSFHNILNKSIIAITFFKELFRGRTT